MQVDTLGQNVGGEDDVVLVELRLVVGIEVLANRFEQLAAVVG